MSFNIDVIVNDYYHLMGGEGGAFIKNSNVSRACNDYNGSTVCIYVT